MSKNPFGNPSEKSIVYVREAAPEMLPDELRSAPGKFFAVHDEQGNCLAVTADRKVAFVLARRNDFAPVSVH